MVKAFYFDKFTFNDHRFVHVLQFTGTGFDYSIPLTNVKSGSKMNKVT